MNLFRSEEHVRRWSGFREEARGGMLPLADMMSVFSARLFRERLNGKYVSNMKEYRQDFMEQIRVVTSNNPFWRVK